MGYAIQYDTAATKKYPMKRRNISLKGKKVCLAVVSIILIAVLLQFSAVRRFLLPGDPVVTERAITKMVDELQAGDGLQEAITTFCREVINNDLTE